MRCRNPDKKEIKFPFLFLGMYMSSGKHHNLNKGINQVRMHEAIWARTEPAARKIGALIA